MIDVEIKYLSMIKSILSQHVPEYQVWVFGSRVTGKASVYSDLDLVLIGNKKLDRCCMEELKSAFSESDVPFKVDVADWHDMPDWLQKAILEQYEVLQ